MALPITPPMIRPIILSSPLFRGTEPRLSIRGGRFGFRPEHASRIDEPVKGRRVDRAEIEHRLAQRRSRLVGVFCDRCRSEDHTSELQSLMRASYAVVCLQQNKTIKLQI